MDGTRFDTLTRSLVLDRSRRSVLTGLLGGVLGVVRIAEAPAKKKKACCKGTGGCCAGEACQAGNLQSSCGPEGKPCVDCTETAELCINRKCSGCDQALCAEQRNGCCSSKGCLNGSSEQNCGSDGRTCMKCNRGERCQVVVFFDGVRRSCCAQADKTCDPLTVPCCPDEGSCLPRDDGHGFKCCRPEETCNDKCCDSNAQCDQATGECRARACDFMDCSGVGPEGVCTEVCGYACCVGFSECAGKCSDAKACADNGVPVSTC